MMKRTLLLLSLLAPVPVRAELRIPGCTAYGAPGFDALRTDKDRGVTGWTDAAQSVLWFGECKAAGRLDVSLQVDFAVPPAAPVKFKLTVAGKSAEAEASASGVVSFGSFAIPAPGYQKFVLESPNPSGDLVALVLDGPAAEGAHFNTDPRRNAASVHLAYPVPGKTDIQAFYCEVTAVEDPVYTYYMATGFSRGILACR